MGCGLISQRGQEASDPARVPSSAAAQRQRQGYPQHDHYPQGHPRHHRGGRGGGGVRGGGAGAGDDDDREAGHNGEAVAAPHGAGNVRFSEERLWRHRRDEAPGIAGRRFSLGERQSVPTRIQGNLQDHAFCFECGAFFPISGGGPGRAPTCTRCGSSFVQYLRAAGSENWVSADGPNGSGYAFDDQLENSITASLEETPMAKRPTQGVFLRSLPSLRLSASEVDKRSKLPAADPRCHCAICRDQFAVNDELRRLPCGHEFHDGCVLTWLQSNNTCPICRCKMPEAKDGDSREEEHDENEVIQLKRHPHGEAASEGWADSGGGDRRRGGRDGIGLSRDIDDVAAEGPSGPRSLGSSAITPG
eukprot:TRINITY_DN65363_c0_g1_i1.p1 TRINITY_DN65363_c0_g1~~TRINITY_DN65363_c0_g1_i1.p1  ORF type:complete len:381 (+),score=56.06 TRINITY_DN65363_c0_g1_i1:63-1145(+)